MKRSALLMVVMLLLPHTSEAQSFQPEDFSQRYQFTYSEQRHSGFRQGREPASDSLGLTNAADRMFTATATAYLGARWWSGGEIYVNVESAAGVPFTRRLIGLGGFPSGEITRGASTQPTTYLQRLFVRQTWGLGGGAEEIESDINQLAALVDRHRVVLTFGNFSLLDVFDNNAYAKDPRTQFMNWSNWTYAAYDYAADARGFGWGAALAWHMDDWVIRLGRMTTPSEPNGPSIDPSIFKHYGDQIEVERRHTLGGRHGKLRVLAWRNRAVLARFSDALKRYQAVPADRQPILSVRNREQIKYGLGLNVEQELASGLGVFFRVMHADGKTETVSFTEVDRSLSVGVLIEGGLWGRSQDSIGVAYARNYLSSDRRQYLESGALSFFIGDGYLQYRPESIVEAFYSLGFAREAWITANIQRLRNPAYNADRGPVNVAGLRLHLQF